MRRKRKYLWIIPVVLGLFAAVFLIYAGQYYHADAAAMEALASNESVNVQETDYGWFFDGPGEEEALIFYPGAKVEETAYAPLMRELAEQGMDACLVRMPFRFAFFGIGKADRVMAEQTYERWYIGGHSLGGAMAAAYAAENGDKLAGAVLLAAYGTEELDEALDVTVIYGSEDKVLNLEKYNENRENLPENALEHVIEGGNHAQFGSYGAQKGDGQAAISAEEQVEETVRVIAERVK